VITKLTRAQAIAQADEIRSIAKEFTRPTNRTLDIEVPHNRSKSITVTWADNGEKEIFESIQAAARTLGVSDVTISRIVKGQREQPKNATVHFTENLNSDFVIKRR